MIIKLYLYLLHLELVVYHRVLSNDQLPGLRPVHLKYPERSFRIIRPDQVIPLHNI